MPIDEAMVQQRIAELEQARDSYIQAHSQHTQAAEQAKASAQACNGAIQELSNLLLPQHKGEVGDDGQLKAVEGGKD